MTNRKVASKIGINVRTSRAMSIAFYTSIE
jgi:hypothetical protein